MRKKLLFVLAAVFLTAMIFSTVSVAVGPIGPNPDGLGPCTCEIPVDADGDGICDDPPDGCGLHIPHGDGDQDGDQEGDPDCIND